MIRGTKINYSEFIVYLQSVSICRYLKTFRCPILLGRSIFEGDVRKATLHEYNQTFLFQEKEDKSTVQANAIKKMMYMLRKVDDQGLKTQRFSIGRDASNDIVVVDYTVSKRHAEIQFTEQGYFLVDFRSRNGSTLNGTPMLSNRAYPIKEKDIFSFGRIAFILLRPISAYISYRIFQKKEKLLRGDFRELARKSSIMELQKMARERHIAYEELEKEDLISLLLKHVDPVILLYRLAS